MNLWELTCLKVEVNHIWSIWTFDALSQQNQKTHIFSQKLILCPLHSQSCTLMKLAKSTLVCFLLDINIYNIYIYIYIFQHKKCWQLTWVVDQVKKYMFETRQPLHRKTYETKKKMDHRLRSQESTKKVALRCETVAQIHGESRDALQCPWWCNGLGRAAVGTTPEFLSGRHVATLTAVLLRKNEASTHFSTQTCLSSSSSSS